MASQGIPYGGVLLDQQTISALQSAQSIAGFNFTLSQGSFNAGGVAASAGTHDGGGALDASVSGLSTDQQVAMVRALRQAGFAAWRRTPDEGFVDHVHAVLIGDPLLSSAAAAQVSAFKSGLDGLAGNGPDNNPIDVAAGRPNSTSPTSGVTPVGATGNPSGFSISPDGLAKSFAQSLLSGVGDSLLKPLFKYGMYIGEILIGVGLMMGGAFMAAQKSDTVKKVEKTAATVAMVVPK